ncbi:hypothetical protein ACFWPB_13095, partial [Rhodococcus sp. NPDC058514]
MTATAALHRAWALDLDTRTLYDLLRLRVDVFVVGGAGPETGRGGGGRGPPTKPPRVEKEGPGGWGRPPVGGPPGGPE